MTPQARATAMLQATDFPTVFDAVYEKRLSSPAVARYACLVASCLQAPVYVTESRAPRGCRRCRRPIAGHVSTEGSLPSVHGGHDRRARQLWEGSSVAPDVPLCPT
jgi:hypothetical protein